MVQYPLLMDRPARETAEMARSSKFQKIWKISSEKCPTHLFGFGAARYFAFWSSLRQAGLVSGLGRASEAIFGAKGHGPVYCVR